MYLWIDATHVDKINVFISAHGFTQNFDDVCLGHLFTYRDFSGEACLAVCVYIYS